MKKNLSIEYCLCLIAKAISSIARFIPIGIGIVIGRAVGFLAYYFFLKKRRIAYKNLKIAFPHYSCNQINKIVRQVFMNCSQHIVELFYLPWMDKRYIKKHIEVEGLDEVLNSNSNKRGKIFLGLHEGSWEVAGIVMSQLLEKYNFSILARTQKDIPLLNELLNQYRTGKNCKIITLENSFRPLVEHLKNGFILGMVGDHGAQGGIFVDFFGKPSLTPTGAIKLTLKLDIDLVIGFMKRTSLANHKIYFTRYAVIKTTDTDQDIKLNLENINRKYEEYIRNDPAEYLWFFKRWKYSKHRKILVLSDGKLGHLKQSLAVLDIIKSLPLQIESKVVEIKFKNGWQKAIFQICGFFFSKRCQGCLSCLKFLLDKKETGALLSDYYDAIISCGSSLAMVNRLVAFESAAKSIVIMKPGMFSLKRFDLAIIPAHDKVPKFNNVVFIKGALSRTIDKDDERIKSIIREYSLDAPLLSRPTIGVLLGGENKYFSLDIGFAESIIGSLDEVVERIGGSVLISTSRRTTRDVEDFLREKLPKRKGYRMLIIANESNPQGSLETILHLSDILVVTGDSISMISEAVNVKKHVIVLKLERKGINFISKHEKFVDGLEREGYLDICRDNLFAKINEVWKHKPTIKETQDKNNILEKLGQIL